MPPFVRGVGQCRRGDKGGDDPRRDVAAGSSGCGGIADAGNGSGRAAAAAVGGRIARLAGSAWLE